MLRRLFPLALWVAVLLLLSKYALSATLQVSPVTLNMSATQQATAVYLTNTGKTAIHAQIRLYDWQQRDGQDVLTESDAVVSSPAMTSLAPGQQQLVRIIVLRPQARAYEQSYRLIVDELPGSSTQGERNAVHFLLRYSIPLFIAADAPPASSTPDRLQCSFNGQDDGVLCRNDGSTHIRLSQLEALNSRGQVIERLPGLAGYILPGQALKLPLRHSQRPSLVSLRTLVNENPDASPLAIAASADPAAADHHAAAR